jgi:hypothetical protein
MGSGVTSAPIGAGARAEPCAVGAADLEADAPAWTGASDGFAGDASFRV